MRTTPRSEDRTLDETFKKKKSQGEIITTDRDLIVQLAGRPGGTLWTVA